MFWDENFEHDTSRMVTLHSFPKPPYNTVCLYIIQYITWSYDYLKFLALLPQVPSASLYIQPHGLKHSVTQFISVFLTVSGSFSCFSSSAGTHFPKCHTQPESRDSQMAFFSSWNESPQIPGDRSVDTVFLKPNCQRVSFDRPFWGYITTRILRLVFSKVAGPEWAWAGLCPGSSSHTFICFLLSCERLFG